MISNANVGSIKSGSGNDSITLNQRLDYGIDTGAGDDTIRIYGSAGNGYNISGANHPDASRFISGDGERSQLA